MKLSTQRDTLFAQLQTVTRAASTRSAVQALSGVQILASGAGIELRATDMEIGLRVPLDGEVIREGSVVLPARLLVDVIRSLPGDTVALELRTAEQDVEIVAGAATFHIRTLRLEDFPPFPEADSEGRVLVPGEVRVTYQSYEDGGCTNSATFADGAAVVQATAAGRRVPHGALLRLTA